MNASFYNKGFVRNRSIEGSCQGIFPWKGLGYPILDVMEKTDCMLALGCCALRKRIRLIAEGSMRPW